MATAAFSSWRRCSASIQAREEGGAWYLAQYKPRNLERAVLNLKRQSFSIFCPKQIVTAPGSQSRVFRITYLLDLLRIRQIGVGRPTKPSFRIQGWM
jgi:hypothetical protein